MRTTQQVNISLRVRQGRQIDKGAPRYVVRFSGFEACCSESWRRAASERDGETVSRSNRYLSQTRRRRRRRRGVGALSASGGRTPLRLTSDWRSEWRGSRLCFTESVKDLFFPISEVSNEEINWKISFGWFRGFRGHVLREIVSSRLALVSFIFYLRADMSLTSISFS